MMMLWPLAAFLYVLAVHYIADFLCQTSWMARRKATCTWALTVHVGVYTTVLLCGSLIVFEPWFAIVFAGINGVVHGWVDAITSKVTAWAHARGHERTFFNVIGFDQLLHQATLAITLMGLIRMGV